MEKNNHIFLSFFCGILLATGCTSSDSNTVSTTGTGTETAINTEEADHQHTMDPNTDMSRQDATDTNISSSNQVGREMNIVALIQQNPTLSTFLELIKAADMVVVLESSAPYTVFAPTNEAFAMLPEGTIAALKQPGNKMELTRLIQSHVLPNKIASAEMQDSMPMKTAQGEEVIARRNGATLTVGGATVILSDVDASNGIIHVIDKVLVPPQD